MAIITVERLADLTPERYSAIMTRSMEELGDVYEDVRAICHDIRARGDAVTLEHYRKLKDDISAADLKVTPEEIEADDEVDRLPAAYEKPEGREDQLAAMAAVIERAKLALL